MVEIDRQYQALAIVFVCAVKVKLPAVSGNFVF
jgi:hypothetical protein